MQVRLLSRLLMITLKNKGKVAGGNILVFTNAPEDVGRVVAIWPATPSNLDRAVSDYGNSPYYAIRWASWKAGPLPQMGETLCLQGT